jgi:hypothetical protein
MLEERLLPKLIFFLLELDLAPYFIQQVAKVS